MYISLGASIAINGLAYMASQNPDNLISAVEMLEYLEEQLGKKVVSDSLLRKVFHRMSQKGLLAPTFGRKGGYRLGKSPELISLYDVITAIDGPIPAGYPSMDKLPDKSKCKVYDVLCTARERVIELLKDKTIYSVSQELEG